MNKKWLHTGAGVLAAATLTSAITTMPAHAFVSDSSATLSGVKYSAHAHSCNTYTSSCSWDSSATASTRKTFTHTTDVKANGINVSISISADPSVSISGNSTNMAHASRKVAGTRSSMSGVARPSIFSISVAARSRLSTRSGNVTTGWTTW